LRFVAAVVLAWVDDIVAFLEVVFEVVLAHFVPITAHARSETTAGSVLCKRVGEQRARIRAPSAIGIGTQWLGERREEGRPPLRRVEVAREREHGRVVEGRVAMRVAAGGVHEQRAANGCVMIVVAQRDVRSGTESGNDELDVVSRSGHSPSQQPSLSRQRGHCHVACRHSIFALQRRQSSTTCSVTTPTVVDSPDIPVSRGRSL
jgi:hypothetical protein